MSVLLTAGVVLAACGPHKSAAPAATGHVTVFAATSLTAAFGDLGEAFETAHRATKVTFNFGASSALVQQVAGGASFDVFASADAKTMATLVADHRVVTPVVFAHNRLVIVTKPGNPAHVSSLADLAHAGTISLCAAEVPCGSYAAQALHKAGVTIDESHVTRAANVAAALTAVTDGDAAAGIVYATDARAVRGRVATVAVPDADNVIADYPIARTRATTDLAGARAFVAFVRSAAGQAILARYGFITA